jgi:superfamily II helicase
MTTGDLKPVASASPIARKPEIMVGNRRADIIELCRTCHAAEWWEYFTSGRQKNFRGLICGNCGRMRSVLRDYSNRT